MRNRRYILDRYDFKTGGLERTDGRLSSLSGSLYENFYGFQSMLHCCFRCRFCGGLCCVRRRFSRSFEAHFTGGCPAQSISVCVGDGDNRIIERRTDMCGTFFDILTFAAFSRYRFFRCNLSHVLVCHSFLRDCVTQKFIISSCLQWSLPDPCVFLHWSWSADLSPAVPCGDAILCTNQFRLSA